MCCFYAWSRLLTHELFLWADWLLCVSSFSTSLGFFSSGIQSHVLPLLLLMTMTNPNRKKPLHSLPCLMRWWHHWFICNGQILYQELERSWIKFWNDLYWAPTICQALGLVYKVGWYSDSLKELCSNRKHSDPVPTPHSVLWCERRG